MAKLYYIQDCRQIVGNCAYWWAKNDAGYTCNLDEAAVKTEEEVNKRTWRKTDIPRDKEVVDSHAVRHFRADRDWEQIGMKPMVRK